MKTSNRFRWVAALSVLLAGCAASPSPTPVLLSLPPAVTAAAPVAVPAASTSPALLAIRRVGIPEYLVARRVRYRADASTLAEWPNTYWAERIEIGVSREFVSALRPRVAILTAGTNTRVSDDVLRRYQEVGAIVYRTDVHGAVTVETDGRRLTVSTFTGARAEYSK